MIEELAGKSQVNDLLAQLNRVRKRSTPILSTVNAHEAKAQLSALIAHAEAGEEVVIGRANKPVVRLVLVTPPKVQRRLGEAKGLVRIAPDFDDLPENLMEYSR